MTDKATNSTDETDDHPLPKSLDVSDIPLSQFVEENRPVFTDWEAMADPRLACVQLHYVTRGNHLSTISMSLNDFDLKAYQGERDDTDSRTEDGEKDA